ncbi:hypothetical protein RRR_06500 [Rickettsia rickettsii str. R]|nr:hypothetical protein RRR_06500 [Rickettsia rickettsii str. R]AJG35174.1 hypothetical protein RRM_06515 [Rickettsia rickettsii str. Morgan]
MTYLYFRHCIDRLFRHCEENYKVIDEAKSHEIAMQPMALTMTI